MRLMARRATFQLDRSVFERKRSALLTMALQAPRLIAIDYLQLLQPRAAVRIVAIDAGHCFFRHRMMMGPLELGHHAPVAALAQLRHLLRSGHIARWRGVDLVAGRTLHLIAAVRRHIAPVESLAVEVAALANLGGLNTREFGRLPYVLRIDGFGMLRARAVAGFADLAAEVLFGLAHGQLVDDVMPVAQERL